jgi:hypothetical protein
MCPFGEPAVSGSVLCVNKSGTDKRDMEMDPLLFFYKIQIFVRGLSGLLIFLNYGVRKTCVAGG